MHGKEGYNDAYEDSLGTNPSQRDAGYCCVAGQYLVRHDQEPAHHGDRCAEQFIHVHLFRKGIADTDHGQDCHNGKGGVCWL